MFNITPETQESWGWLIGELISQLSPATPTEELGYLIMRMIKKASDGSPQRTAAIMGMLECLKHEYYTKQRTLG